MLWTFRCEMNAAELDCSKVSLGLEQIMLAVWVGFKGLGLVLCSCDFPSEGLM